MSEPVSHAEIEDVLSSIRRLVSEDGREPLVPVKPAATGKPAARLVLTPSLRVADEPVITSVVRERAETSQAEVALVKDVQPEETLAVETQPEETLADDNQAQETLADDSQADTFQAEDALARQSDLQADETPNRINTGILGSVPVVVSDDEPEIQSSDELENEQTADAPFEESVAEWTVESTSVEPETHSEAHEGLDSGARDGTADDTQDNIQDQIQGDDTVLQTVGSVDEDQQTGPVQLDDAPWQNPDATLFAAAGVTETISDTTAEGDAPDAAKSTVSFAEKIAALEAAIGQADEQWEPEGDTGEDNSGTAVETLAWEDLEEELDHVTPFSTADADEFDDSSPAQVDITPEFDQPEFDQAEFDQAAVDEPERDQPNADILDAAHLAEQAVADEILGGVSADEAVMDEETLRELVADIVREELQGALGERITRNVRKLVRREIHRALAVQDLG